MSASAASGSSGLPVSNQALEPGWVRRGSPSTQKAYAAALSFESTLVEQLSRSLTASSGLGGEPGGEGESPAPGGEGAPGAQSSPISSLLPQALTSGVMSAGGLGLAAQLTRELQGPHGAADAAASGATGAPSGGTSAPSSATGAPSSGGTGAPSGAINAPSGGAASA